MFSMKLLRKQVMLPVKFRSEMMMKLFKNNLILCSMFLCFCIFSMIYVFIGFQSM